MTVRIENQTGFFTTENGETEAGADALTVAGAVDGRRHLKTTDSGSVI